MINDVLDLAKIESGKSKCVVEMSCQEVLAEAVSALRPLAEPKSPPLMPSSRQSFLVRNERGY
jgi:signal transduction histidine kinase